MAQNEKSYRFDRLVMPRERILQNQATNMASVAALEEDMLADVDEPPDLGLTPRPSARKLHDSYKTSFLKTRPVLSQRRESLLTNALLADGVSSTDEHPDDTSEPQRGMSAWSYNSVSTAELTSDVGSPGTRISTPSPPLPPSTFRSVMPVLGKKPLDESVSIMPHEDDVVSPLLDAPKPASGERSVEASLGRKRCISFVCGRKESAPSDVVKTSAPTIPAATEPPRRVSTIKFACPSKLSVDAPSKSTKARVVRAASPAPPPRKTQATSRVSPKAHRGSDSTVRNPSPVSVRKQPQTKDRTRRLSENPDLARSEAYRFHEFASSEEEVDEWTQESTCHRSRLTINDTLKIENNLRQLGEEVEEEALEEDEEENDEDDQDDAEDDEDDDEDGGDSDDDGEQDADTVVSDEGFQTDDEQGFAGSDDESDAGSDYNWWTPGAFSTAATSVEHLEHIRPTSHRSFTDSSVGSVDSNPAFKIPERHLKRNKSRAVNIRAPSPELPDSTDFVCGTLDEDRPLEAAYLSCLERRRAAKHKITPQDIDPTFPTSDPEMDEEDEDDEVDVAASESEAHVMVHGQMDPVDGDSRGRSKVPSKVHSPAPSPKRLRSPPPIKRAVHRSPPPRKVFGHSPKRMRSPAPGARLRSPPPTRRGSTIPFLQRNEMTIKFAGLAERPPLTTSSSLPRTPVSRLASQNYHYDDEDTCREMPVRRAAMDIKIGLEKKRQRRKEQLYKKAHRKGTKDKRCAPGKGLERMRDVGLGLAAHKGKPVNGFALGIPSTPDGKDMHVLSV
jgi:hypothetical protein